MMRWMCLWMLALLAGCIGGQGANPNSAASGPVTPTPAAFEAGAVCRVGPDGEPVAEEPSAAASKITERGIGGTGAPSTVAERGIGGTGIIGVITGFASICVNGLEVHYDGSATIEIDGATASASALRAGQIVAIQTAGSPGASLAQTISVRREVAGRIEAVELGSGALTVAGQPVTVPAGTWGADSVRLGDWVAISGLRRADGVLVASRLDTAPADSFVARGPVVREGGVTRVGQLVLTGPVAAGLSSGQMMEVSGHYVAGQARVGAVAPDRIFPHAATYFGPLVNHVFIQGFVHVADGTILLNGLKVAADMNLRGKPGADGIAVVSLDRQADGTFAAVGLRYTDRIGPGSGAVRIPGRGARGGSTAPPLVRRGAGSLMASVADNGGGAASSGPAAAIAPTIDPAESSSSGPDTSPPTTVSFTTPVRPLPERPVSPVIISPVGILESRPIAVPISAPLTTPASSLPATNSFGAGGPTIERLSPSAISGSELISRSHKSDGALPVASANSRQAASTEQHKVATGHPVVIGGSTSHPNITLATGATGSSQSAPVAIRLVPPTSRGKATSPKVIGTSSGPHSVTEGGRQHGR
jgi:hypothetical protein